MPRLYMLLLAVILGGCIFISDEPPVTPTPTPTPEPVPALKVLEATYGTNFSVNGKAAICSNRSTTLTYRFRYQGELTSWTSYLRGVVLDQVKGERTFTPDGAGVNPYETNGYEVIYTLGANFAPYANSAEEPSPKAIVVVPVPQPVQIGASKLHLILEGAGGDSQPYVSPEIPVIENCPTN